MERGGLTQRLGELLMQSGTHPCTFSGYLSSLSLIPFSFLFFFFHFSFSSFLSFLCHFSFPLFVSYLISLYRSIPWLWFTLFHSAIFVFVFVFLFPFHWVEHCFHSSSCLLQCLFTTSFHQLAFAPFNFLSLTQRHSNIPQCLWFFFNPPATSKELQCLEGDSFTLSPVSAPSPVEILFTNSPFKSLLSSPQVKSQQNQVRSRLVDQTRKQLVIVLQLWCFLVPWYRL